MLNFGGKTLKVLLVGGGHELGYALIVLNGVKGLTPLHLGAASLWLELDGQYEVMPGQVLDLEDIVGFDAGEAALIRIVLTIRPVHC